MEIKNYKTSLSPGDTVYHKSRPGKIIVVVKIEFNDDSSEEQAFCRWIDEYDKIHSSWFSLSELEKSEIPF